MITSRSAIAAHALAGSALLLSVGFVLLLLPMRAEQLARIETTTAGGFVLGATFPIVGWLVASKRPANAMGWIFLGVGLSQALDSFASQYAQVGLVVHPGSLPAADVLAWVASWVWAPGFALLLTATPLLFPDGQPPSPRWRPVLWAAGLAVVLLVVPIAVIAWPSRGVALLGSGPDPSVVGAGDPVATTVLGILGALTNVGLLLLLASAASSVAGLIVRFRRSSGVERAQLKWFAAAGVVEIALLVASSLEILPWSQLNLALAVAVCPLLPMAATIAILRYHLYEIDRIVSRSLAYVVVSGVLAGVFALLVVTLQGLLSPITRSNALAVAASTMTVAALFQPVRRRIQRAVDHRFNRARVDAERVEGELAVRLRDEIDAGSVVGVLVASVEETVQPTFSTVWIRANAR